MKKIEIISKALEVCTSPDYDHVPEWRRNIFALGNKIGATDGYILTFVHRNKIDEAKVKLKHPNKNAEKAIRGYAKMKNYKLIGSIMVDDIDVSIKSDCYAIYDTHLSAHGLKNIVRIAKILVISHLNAYINKIGDMFMFRAKDVKIMCTHYIADNIETIEQLKLIPFAMDLADINYEKGESFLEEERKAEEEAEKQWQESKKLWTIRVCKYSYVYVEATTEKEAEKIAIEDLDIADFEDSDVEIDGVDGITEEREYDYIEKIITKDGVINADDYFEE